MRSMAERARPVGSVCEGWKEYNDSNFLSGPSLALRSRDDNRVIAKPAKAHCKEGPVSTLNAKHSDRAFTSRVTRSDIAARSTAAAAERAPLLTARRHADHCRELRQNQRAVPQPGGPRPPLPCSGARVPTLVRNCANAVCTSTRLRARRAHSRRRARMVDSLLGDTLRWRRALLHWYPRRPGSGKVLPAVPAQHWGHRVLAGGAAGPIEDGERRGTPAPSEGLLPHPAGARQRATGSHGQTHVDAVGSSNLTSERSAPPLGS